MNTSANISWPTSLPQYFVGFDRIYDLITNFPDRDSGFPPSNLIQEDENKYIIEFALAGYNEKDLSIEVATENGSQQLTIEGKIESEDNSTREYRHKGIAQRAFRKSYSLAEHVVVNEASLDTGILKIHLEEIVPEEKKPKLIAIKTKKWYRVKDELKGFC